MVGVNFVFSFQIRNHKQIKELPIKDIARTLNYNKTLEISDCHWIWTSGLLLLFRPLFFSH